MSWRAENVRRRLVGAVETSNYYNLDVQNLYFIYYKKWIIVQSVNIYYSYLLIQSKSLSKLFSYAFTYNN